MKKILALITVALLCATMLCGCSEKKSNDNAKTDDATDATTQKVEQTAEPTTFDAGDVSVDVPSGWKAFAVPEVFAEDGSMDPTSVRVCKGGKTDVDIFTHPYIQINYYGAETEMMTPMKEFYDDTADIEPIVAGAMTWNGFTGDSLGYKIAILWAEDGDDQYQATMYLETDNGTITLDDADVQAILASVKASA